LCNQQKLYSARKIVIIKKFKNLFFTLSEHVLKFQPDRRKVLAQESVG
jgi:hypothetical protein